MEKLPTWPVLLKDGVEAIKKVSDPDAAQLWTELDKQQCKDAKALRAAAAGAGTNLDKAMKGS